MITELFSAWLIGLVSAGHCLGMCGGLMVAAGINSSKPSLSVSYNLGRITTYTLLGLLFGLIAGNLPIQVMPLLKLLSGILLLLSALYLLGLSQLLNQFEKIGLPFWRKIQPVSRKMLPIRSIPTAYGLGLIWGFIPCGLVYTALTFSLSAGNSLASAGLMLSFGLGTLPAMIGVSLLAQQVRSFLSIAGVRFALASILIGLSALFCIQAIQALR